MWKTQYKSISTTGKLTNEQKLTHGSLNGHWSLSGGRRKEKGKWLIGSSSISTEPEYLYVTSNVYGEQITISSPIMIQVRL